MDQQLEKVIEIARNAGEILLKYFGKELSTQYKTDRFDPVTLADREADEYLRKAFSENFPHDQILSEENSSRPSSYDGRIWMIDPLDGTKDFVAGRDSFATLI